MKPSHHSLASALPMVAASVTITLISSAAAAPVYWKTSTAAAWDSATWASAPGGPYDQPWASASDVIFEDNLGTTLTIAGPAATTNFTSITANENVTVTPSSTLGTGGAIATIDVAAGKTLDFAGQNLSTAVGTGFIKNGPGTWSLANGNTYAGGFTLNAGTVAVGGVNAMGAGGTLVINGGTIRSNGTANRDLSGKFTSITLGGDVALGDAVNNGVLTFNSGTSLGAATRTLTVTSAVTHNGAISGPGVGLIKAGPGVLTLGGANTYGGPTTISAGILSLTNSAALPGGLTTNGTYSVASGAGLAVPNTVTDANITTMLGTTNFAAGSAIGFDTTAGARTYSANLGNIAAGNLGLVKTGTNTLTLSGTNTHAAGTTVNQANDSIGITVANASALGSGAVVVNGGQSFSGSVSVNANLTLANALTLKRGATGGNRAVLTLGAGATWSGNITVDNSSPNGLAVIATGGASAATACVVSGDIGYSTLGTPSSASATLALRTSNNFGRVTGSIGLSNGYLVLLDTTKWEFSNASNTWGTLDISNAGAIATVGATNTLSPSGVVASTVGGTLQLNNQTATTAYSQSIAGLSGNVKVGFATGVTGPATLTLNTSADLTSSGVISGAISLVKSGTGKQTLTGANTYTGTTTINGGTLALGTTGALGSGDLSISSATLDLRKGTAVRSQIVNNLSLSGATLEIGLNATPDQIDALGATVTGTNTLRLYGSVPTGSYEVIRTGSPLSGTFVLDTSGVTPSGFPVSYNGSIDGNSYVLNVTGAATPSIAYWRGDVSSTWNDSSLAPNSNWATNSEGTTDAGQIPGAITDVFFTASNAVNTNTTLGANININSLTFESGTATVGGANTLTILNEFGTGLDVFSGANATLNTGSTVCTAASSVQAGGTLTVNSGGLGAGPLVVDGILNLNMDVTKETLAGAATGTISRGIPGASVLTVSSPTSSNNTLYEGTLGNGAGTLALIKGGTSTLILAGTNDYSGGTVGSPGTELEFAL